MKPLALLAVLILLALAGCGSGGSAKESAADAAAQQAATEESQPVPETKPPKVTNVKPPAAEADVKRKPKVSKGSGSAPKQLVAERLIPGSGSQTVKDGDSVTVEYVGVLFKNGKQFDTSWGKQPFTFPVGQGQVIPGWDQGLLGMKVGERRKLVIPADLAYGAQGSPPKIGPDEPLIFDVDLKKIG